MDGGVRKRGFCLGIAEIVADAIWNVSVYGEVFPLNWPYVITLVSRQLADFTTSLFVSNRKCVQDERVIEPKLVDKRLELFYL